MTDKERLEDIKLKFNNTIDIMLYVPYEDVKFLIEQAERAKELERKIERYREAIEVAIHNLKDSDNLGVKFALGILEQALEE